jgi:uncharacterized membrane protein YczE
MVIEVSVVAVGWVLGGTLGVGAVVYAVAAASCAAALVHPSCRSCGSPSGASSAPPSRSPPR